MCVIASFFNKMFGRRIFVVPFVLSNQLLIMCVDILISVPNKDSQLFPMLIITIQIYHFQHMYNFPYIHLMNFFLYQCPYL